MGQETSTIYQIGPFQLDTDAQVVTHDGATVALGARGVTVLSTLVGRASEFVSKSEIFAAAWPGLVVEEGNLAVQISSIRRALAQAPGGDAWIETLARRFVGPVSRDCSVTPRRDDGVEAGSEGSVRTLPPLPERPSIAVLPFANMSGDPEQEYFADGMVDDIISALARMELFFVIARNSSFVYKGRPVDIRQVGRELGVRYVLEGSVRRSGIRIRITGQLIESANGRHIWADRFEGTLEDTFELQDRFTEGVVSAIEPNVRRAELERSRVQRTSNPNAYDLLLRAVPGIITPNASNIQNDEALAWIRRALEVDPHYSFAKALGAFACARRMVDGYGRSEDVKTGLRYADEALSERSSDPLILSYAGAVLAGLGYRVLGLRVLGFRYEEAQRAIELAESLSPSLLMVQVCAGNVRAVLGDGEAALANFQHAIRISPIDPSMSAFIASTSLAQLLAGRFEEALTAVQRAIAMSPDLVLGHRLMVLALASLSRPEDAKHAAHRLLELAPGFTVTAYQRASPLKDAAHRKRFAETYRDAGVPN